MAVKRTVDTLCPDSQGSWKPTWEWPFGRNHSRLHGCLSNPTSDLSLHSSLGAKLDYMCEEREGRREAENPPGPLSSSSSGSGKHGRVLFPSSKPLLNLESILYRVYWGERDIISLCKYTVEPGSQELNIHPWLLSSNIKDAWHTVSATCLTRYLISF